MNLMAVGFLGGAVALVTSLMLTHLVARGAVRTGWVRGAQADRWHRRPTPAIGGVAIFLAFGFGLAVVAMAGVQIRGSALEFRVGQAFLPWPFWVGLLAAAAVAFLVGLLDDLSPLSPMTKLAGQLGAATILVLSGIGVWITDIYLLDAALSLFWFVAVTNAMNLLDNMDGLAAGTALIAAAFLVLLAFLEGQTTLILVGIPFLGAVLGFLAHNYPPARIFMGDSGSLFLGIFLAGMALAPAPGLSRSLLAVLAAPALVLALPLLDTTLVTVGRVLEGRPVAQGGTDHTSHRLVALGASEVRAVWILWALAGLGGTAGLLLRTRARSEAVLLGGLILVALAVLAGYLLRVRFQGLPREARARVPLYRVVLELHHRFPLATFVLDGVLTALAYYAAYLIRWDAGVRTAELTYFQQSVAVMVTGKLLAFAVSGVYVRRWDEFGFPDAWWMVRANVLGSVLAVTGLVLVERVGLSRGVVALDLLLCILLTVGVRLSGRIFERSQRGVPEFGTPTLVLGTPSEAGLLLRLLAREASTPEGVALRPVGVADPEYPRRRSVMRGLPLFGTDTAVADGLAATGAGAVVLAASAGGEGLPAGLEQHLAHVGSVDVYRLGVDIRRVGS